MLKRIVVALALVVFAAPALAGFQVNTYRPNEQTNASVAALNNGGFVVVWLSQQGVGRDIYAQIFDKFGIRVGKEFRVNTVVLGDQARPTVAALNDGGFVATWASADGDGGGISGQRFDSAGKRIAGEFRINTNIANTQSMPSVAGLSDGGFVVVWVSYPPDVDFVAITLSIRGQRYDASGKPSNGEFMIARTRLKPSEVEPAHVAGLSDGGFVVTWTKDEPRRQSVFARRYNADGAQAGAEWRVAAADPSSEGLTSPKVAGLESGKFVIVWSDPNYPASLAGAFGQRYTATGVPIGNRFRASTVAVRGEQSTVSPLANGGFVVIYFSTLKSGIFGQRFDASGIRTGNEFFAGSVAYSQARPSVAGLDNGGFVVIWAATEKNYEENFRGIFGQRFAP